MAGSIGLTLQGAWETTKGLAMIGGGTGGGLILATPTGGLSIAGGAALATAGAAVTALGASHMASGIKGLWNSSSAFFSQLQEGKSGSSGGATAGKSHTGGTHNGGVGASKPDAKGGE